MVIVLPAVARRRDSLIISAADTSEPLFAVEAQIPFSSTAMAALSRGRRVSTSSRPGSSAPAWGTTRGVKLPEPIAQALLAQLDNRRRVLSGKAGHVGWKIAKSMPGVADHLGPDGAVFGYLTSTSMLQSGQQYRTHAVPSLRAETELAVTLGCDVDPIADPATCRDAIAGVAVALEIVDVAQPPGGDMHDIIAKNVFHRAVAFGPVHPLAALPVQATANITVNGAVRQVGRLDADPAQSGCSVPSVTSFRPGITSSRDRSPMFRSRSAMRRPPR